MLLQGQPNAYPVLYNSPYYFTVNKNILKVLKVIKYTKKNLNSYNHIECFGDLITALLF